MRIHSSVLLALTLFTLMSAEKTSTPLASIQELRKKFEKTEASKQVPPKTKTIPAQAQQAQKAAPISTIPSISITPDNPVSCTQEPCLDNSKLLLQLNHNFTTLTHQALLQSPSFEPFLRYDTQHLLDFSEDRISPQQDTDEIELLRKFIIAKGIECGIPDMAARMDKLDKKITVLDPVLKKIKPEDFIKNSQAFQLANNEALKTCLGLRVWTYISPHKVGYQEKAGISAQAQEAIDLITTHFPPTDLSLAGNDLIFCSEPLLPFSFAAGSHGYQSSLIEQIGQTEYDTLLKTLLRWDKDPKDFFTFTKHMRDIFVNENEFFEWFMQIHAIKTDFDEKLTAVATDKYSSPQAHEIIKKHFELAKENYYKETQFKYDKEQYTWMAQWAPIIPILVNFTKNRNTDRNTPSNCIFGIEKKHEQTREQTIEDFLKTPQNHAFLQQIEKSFKTCSSFGIKAFIDSINFFRDLAFSGSMYFGYDKTDYKQLYGVSFEYACRKALNTKMYLLFLGRQAWHIIDEPLTREYAATIVLSDPTDHTESLVPYYTIAKQPNPYTPILEEYKKNLEQKLSALGLSQQKIDGVGDSSKLKDLQEQQVVGVAKEFLLKPSLDITFTQKT